MQYTEVQVVTIHIPSAVNDPWFVRETGSRAEDVHASGCSLGPGHPQGQTGLRSIAEQVTD